MGKGSVRTEYPHLGWAMAMKLAKATKNTLTVFHGTSHAFATAMVGPPPTIDVKKGGGEFGQGLYTQTSRVDAYRRGFSIYGHQRAVLQLEIDLHAYMSLSRKVLTLNQAQKLWATLKGA